MTQFSKFKISALFFLFPIFYFLFSGNIKAAQFSIIANPVDVRTGEAVVATVLLDTQGKNINAMDGKILFPGDILEIKEIRDGNSVVNLWVERPHLGGPGEIYFSGIVSSGYSGNSGKLFTVVFGARQDGRGGIKIAETRAFLNDGVGTPDTVPIPADLIVRVSEAFPAAAKEANADREPPESFTPEIGQDLNLFGDKYFLAFATVDKGVGVDYYEIMEVPRRKQVDSGSWRRAESPYLLTDQDLKSDIYVRAVDMTGNFIIEKIPARFPAAERDFKKTVIAALAILVMLLLAIWRVKKRIF